MGSCVLNDFFDYSVDIINEPNKVGHASALPSLSLHELTCSHQHKLVLSSVDALSRRLFSVVWLSDPYATSATKHISLPGVRSGCTLQPLPRHAVPLEGALLLSFALYTSVLIAGCMLVCFLPSVNLAARCICFGNSLLL